MSKTFSQVYICVISKVRDFCFAGTTITDDTIGGTTIKALNIIADPRMPGVPPIDGLAANLKNCVEVTIPLDGKWLTDNNTKTVKQVAQYIFNQSEIAGG